MACLTVDLESYQLAEPLSTDPGLKSEIISVQELISTPPTLLKKKKKKKKKKSVGGEWMVEHSPKIFVLVNIILLLVS